MHLSSPLLKHDQFIFGAYSCFISVYIWVKTGSFYINCMILRERSFLILFSKTKKICSVGNLITKLCSRCYDQILFKVI